jgi:peptidoglycan/xylan/chitin deacetylase (PgdA/CDA1 family)
MNPGILCRLFAALWLATAALPAVAEQSAVVLMYHRFAEDRYPATSIRIDQFEAQLKHLREGGYRIVPLADVLLALQGQAELPDRAVAITIDDAYLSVYQHAFPRLKALGFPFTVFVATDPVDQGLPAYMDWNQMREMAAGGASFANHGAAHASTLEGWGEGNQADRLARVKADVEKGARRLADELQPMEGAFAYPYGEYDAAAADMLKDLGYVSFGQQSGAVGTGSDTRALPRYPMAEAFADLGQFRTKVASLPLPVSDIEPWEPVTRQSKPSIVVTLAESDARLADLACFVGGQGRVDVSWLEPGRRFRVGPTRSFTEGRQRVNCTAPRNDGRYLWFSHPWFVQPQED